METKEGVVISGRPSCRRELFRMLPKGLVIAEVGVSAGRLTKIIIEESSPSLLYLIDWWRAGPVPAYSNDLEQVMAMRHCLATFSREVASGTVRPVCCDSLKAANYISDESLDVVYIDADHSFTSVLADLKSWAPKVKNGGIVSGHDYSLCDHTGVRKAVEDFVGGRWKINVTSDEHRSFWFVKQEA